MGPINKPSRQPCIRSPNLAAVEEYTRIQILPSLPPSLYVDFDPPTAERRDKVESNKQDSCRLGYRTISTSVWWLGRHIRNIARMSLGPFILSYR